jgi:hypothetical protein
MIRPTPSVPKITKRNALGKNLSDRKVIAGNHHVSGALRYMSNSRIPSPTPSIVIPASIRKNQRFTPRPGASQRTPILIPRFILETKGIELFDIKMIIAVHDGKCQVENHPNNRMIILLDPML